MSKYSFIPSVNKHELFTTVFPDSATTKNFSCRKTKCSYIVNYGITPYFLELLNSQPKEFEHYLTLFDDSFNHVVKQSQIDLRIQFWDSSNKSVATRYYSLENLGKAEATNIYSNFEHCLESLFGTIVSLVQL